MKLFKKIAAMSIALTLIFTMGVFTVAEEYEVEEIEANIGYEETVEETEYIVYFNDSVASLYCEEGEEFAVMGEEALEECLEEGIVEFYEEDVPMYLYEEESLYDPMQASYKWDLSMVKSDYALDLGYDGEGVKIAVIDSGCNKTGDLKNNILTGYNLVENSTDTTDKKNHGTMVTAQIAAEKNYVGFRGVAPKAQIVPLKVVNDETGKSSASNVARAIKMAVDDYDCKIINLSLGTSSENETLKEAVQYALGKGAILVAAMGNNGTTDYSYPSAYEGVIGVGAINASKNWSSYSQYNDAITVCAPGGDADGRIPCLSPTANNKYLQSYGTSFAAPTVTGIVALFREIDKDFSYEDFVEVAENASIDLGTPGYDVKYGYGLVNIENYLRYYLAPVGDNNIDGVVNAEDAVNIVNYLVGTISSVAKPAMADANGDGNITLIDAMILARYAAGWDGYEFASGN